MFKSLIDENIPQYEFRGPDSHPAVFGIPVILEEEAIKCSEDRFIEKNVYQRDRDKK